MHFKFDSTHLFYFMVHRAFVDNHINYNGKAIFIIYFPFTSGFFMLLQFPICYPVLFLWYPNSLNAKGYLREIQRTIKGQLREIKKRGENAKWMLSVNRLRKPTYSITPGYHVCNWFIWLSAKLLILHKQTSVIPESLYV